jgi:GTP-binding protein HflX
VELAALSYQRSRLVRSWTHLERQRGGHGFMGGPGERQIESDRRQIDTRIHRLKKDLAGIRRTRALHRRARRRVPTPVIALVGYTNSGKSTLFNRLTQSRVAVRDQLFATLDPTMRGIGLPTGGSAILSDTVGFVSQLPHELVAAFHATLEEVIEADLLLHVRDVANPDCEAQRADVHGVLDELGLGDGASPPRIEVLNKTDLLDDAARLVIVNRAARANSGQVPISARTGEGVGELLAEIARQLGQAREEAEIMLPWVHAGDLSWLHEHGEVVERKDEETGIRLRVRLSPADLARFRHRRNGE